MTTQTQRNTLAALLYDVLVTGPTLTLSEKAAALGEVSSTHMTPGPG
ncbi:MAG TPA: hypothetical protein VKN16_02695 [Methylomirabilota bacterium]|jgi:hypothetical protein|nr:hypothetical protein [Methylomirabilota bacterium]